MADVEFWMRAFPEIEDAPPPWEGLRGRLKVPAQDAEDTLGAGPGSEDERLGYAEGQSFAIEYEDAEGNESVRRITVWSIEESTAGTVTLVARCHERKATRRFRIDRIKAVIDYDGEVFSPPDEFFVETFGMSPEMLKGLSNEDALEDLRRAKNILRDEIRLLAALGHADGQLDEREIDEILIYGDWRLGRNDLMLEQAQLAQLRRYIARTRPTREMLMKSIDRIQSRFEPEGLKRLFMAAHAVVKADGEAHEDEMALLEDLYLELTGLPIKVTADDE